MQIISKIIFFIILFSNSAFAQAKFQSLVQSQALSIIKPSVKTAPNVIDVIQTFDSQISNNFLINGISQDTIFLDLGQLVSKKIPLKGNFDFSYKLGYHLKK